MAFLDNSGDIILDAVLTDAGRQRLSRGSFKITKFALGDEEINYETFNGTHPSGSAFYDLVTLQTPILEAFTNNTSMMKSRLMTITRNNILYLPIFKLNNRVDNENATRDPQGDYILLADLNTQKDPANNPAEIAELARGVLRGHIGGTTPSNDVTNHIAVDQGIDSEEGGISFKTEMPNDLVETAFILRADHRLLHLHNISNNQASTEPLTNQFIDDDGIAHYYVALGDGSSTVEGAPTPAGGAGAFGDARRRRDGEIFSNPDLPDDINEAFRGPLGSILRIYPRASLHVEQSSVLFDEIGTTVTSGNDLAISNDVTLQSYKYIDTLINVVGVTTGYSIDIPIRIVKKT